MKKWLISCLLIGLLCRAFGQDKEKEAVKNVNQLWLSSYLKKDTAALNKIFADDMIHITSLGVTLTKKEVLNKMMEPNRKYLSIALDSIISIQLMGKTAVLIAKSTIVRVLDDVQSTIHNSYMTVFEKRKERWMIVATHVTNLSTK